VAHINPSRIILTGAVVDDTATPPSTVPRLHPHDYALALTLKTAARSSRCAPDLLFFELLPEGCSRDSLKSGSMIRIRVLLREQPGDVPTVMKSRTLYASREAPIATLLEPLSLAVENSDMHLIAFKEGRLYHRFRADQLCSEIDPGTLVQSEMAWLVERVPRIRSDEEALVTCVHARPPSNLHLSVRLWGIPFFLLLKNSESVSEFAERVRITLGANKGEFSTWKLAHSERDPREPQRDSLEGTIAVENAMAQTGVGSGWSFANKGHDWVVILHHERADSHTRAVKIQ